MAEAGKVLAYHLDLKRAMPRLDYIAKFAGQLAAWGFNAVVLELENKFRFRKHPLLAHPAAPTTMEMEQLIETLTASGLEVIPLLQTLGHAEHVLTKPGYESMRVAPDVSDVYDPMSEHVKEFLKEIIDDVIERLRPKRFFHVGGDETHGLEKSQSGKAILEGEGVGGLYLHHMLSVFEHVRRRGLRPIVWCDILLAHPELMDRVPRDTVIADWDYWTDAERVHKIHLWGHGRVDWQEAQKLQGSVRQWLDRFAIDEHTAQDGSMRGFFYFDVLCDAGFESLTCSASRSHGDNVGVPNHAVHIPNAFHSARKAASTERALGHLVTSWAVRHNHPETTLPAVFAAALAVQNAEPFCHEKVIRAFTKQTFGRELPELSEVARFAAEKVPFSESWSIHKALAALAKNADPVQDVKSELEGQPGRLKGEIERIAICQKDFQRARTLLNLARRRATSNAESFDYWLEGVELMVFYAEFALAALQGDLSKRKNELLERLLSLRKKTSDLFVRTYHPSSVEEELLVRCSLHETLLRCGGE